MNQASHLFQLQTIDSGIENANFRIEEINSILATNIERQNAENQVKENENFARAARNKLRQIEDEVQTVQAKIETSEAAMYGGKIQNPKELQDLQSETAALKRRLANLEENQLEAMIALEDEDQKLKLSLDALDRVIADLATQQATLHGEKAQLNKIVERLQTERKAIQVSISDENLKLYDRLRGQRKGIAVSRIEDGACQACGASLRPAEVQVAKSPGQLAYCSSCGRILFAG